MDQKEWDRRERGEMGGRDRGGRRRRVRQQAAVWIGREKFEIRLQREREKKRGISNLIKMHVKKY